MFVGERKRQTAAAYTQQDTVPFMQSVDGLLVTWHFTHAHKYRYTATTDDSVALLVLKHNPLLTARATS